jgi:hypothetical protein
LSDLENGLSYLQLGLDVKFDFWARLPWKLPALAHHDLEVARAAATECCEIFDEFVGEDRWGIPDRGVGFSTGVYSGKHQNRPVRPT